jgi:hypothetical protein
MCTYVWKEAPFSASFIVHSWRHEQTSLFVPPQHYRISLMKRHTNVLWLWNQTLESARVPIFNYQTWKHPQRMEPNNFHKKMHVYILRIRVPFSVTTSPTRRYSVKVKKKSFTRSFTFIIVLQYKYLTAHAKRQITYSINYTNLRRMWRNKILISYLEFVERRFLSSGIFRASNEKTREKWNVK